MQRALAAILFLLVAGVSSAQSRVEDLEKRLPTLVGAERALVLTDLTGLLNNDATMHHVVLDDGSADLGDVAPGATSKGVTLKNAGAARFHCTIHSSMVGTINEAMAPPTPPCPDPYGYGC